VFRPPVRALATLLAAAGVASCADAPSALNRPLAGSGLARIGFEPVFSPSAQATASRLADFGITFDHVRIVLARPVTGDVVKDTTIAFATGQAAVNLNLTVSVKADGESFRAGLDYTNPTGVVFHGEAIVQSHALDAPPSPPSPIPVQYVGAGASVTKITVSPKNATVVAPGTLNFTVSAFDASNAPVANTPVNWSSSDPTVATISNTGLLSTTGKRGTVTVTAVTPTNATDNSSVTITLAATGIVLVSGGGQTGKVGTVLSQPAVVRVVASDGLAVAGATVNFAAPIGGSVGAASAVTNASGAASVSMTLGSAIGPQSFAAVSGAFSVSIPATATVGDPAVVAVFSGGSQLDTVTRLLKQPFVAKVTDKFNNPVPGVTVNWTRGKGTGTLSAATSQTDASGQASVTYTLGTLAGVDTVTASTAGVSTPATFSVQAVAGAPAAAVITSGNQQAARILQPLAPFVIKVTDAAGNPNIGVTVNWTAINGSLSATTKTDSLGVTSNTMTLGGTVGTATATATAGSATISFTATVLLGQVARMAFLTTPDAATAIAPTVLKPIKVALQDAGGNITASTAAVTIAIGANPGQTTLVGTLTRNAVAGVATFDDLMIDEYGTGYTLVASTVGVLNTATPPFNVTATLTNVTPSSIDAVFTTVPFTLLGTGFLEAATTVSVTGGQVAVVGAFLSAFNTMTGSFVIPGGISTSVQSITASTAYGPSNALPIQIASVGGATLQLGPSNGGGGGSAYSLDCPAGAVATGLNVRGGSNVDNIQVICQTVTGPARLFGQPTTTGAVGGGGGTPATLACPAGLIMVGLTGAVGSGSGGVNDAIAAVCAALDGGAGVTTPSVGTVFPTSITYTATCPVGLAMTGIQGSAGNLVDRTQIKCR
jgi:Bacterial Ig-like domain (group 1)/Bacterial Ig-like domain (group 2)